MSQNSSQAFAQKQHVVNLQILAFQILGQTNYGVPQKDCILLQLEPVAEFICDFPAQNARIVLV